MKSADKKKHPHQHEVPSPQYLFNPANSLLVRLGTRYAVRKINTIVTSIIFT